MIVASLLVVTMAANAEPLAKYEITKDDGQTAELLASGWWDAEERGAWSGREDVAVLEVPAAPQDGAVLLLNCSTLLPPHYDEGAVSVTVNGEQVRVVPIGANFVCDIPKAARGKPLTVEVEAPLWPGEAFGTPGMSYGFKLARVEVHREPADPKLDLRNYPRRPDWQPLVDTPPEEFVRISEGGLGFEEGGEAYMPFGCNYFDPGTGEMPPAIWSKFDAEAVEEQYGVMEELGVNCARTFLAGGALLKSPFEMDAEILAHMDETLAIASRHNIRVMFTVADFWEPGDYIHSLQPFSSTEQLYSWLSRYCQVLGERYADEPALFSWDLRNEPMVMWDEGVWGQWQFRQWLRSEYEDLAVLGNVWGEEAPGSWEEVTVPPNEDDPGSVRLYDYTRFREELAREWVECQVAGLRAHDRNHPIGVGFIQWSFPAQRMHWKAQPGGYGAYNAEVLADLVDFQMMHFYPMYGDPRHGERQTQENLQYVQACVEACHVGQPIVLAEFGWYGGEPGADDWDERERQLADWCTALIEATEGKVCGWLCWPFANVKEVPDLSSTGGMVAADMEVKPWGQAFQRMAEGKDFAPQRDLSPPHGGRLRLLRRDLYTSHIACQRYMHEYIRERLGEAWTLASNRIEMNNPSPGFGWGFWLPETGDPEGKPFNFQWALGTEALIRVILPDDASTLTFRAHPFGPAGEQWVELTVNGEALPRVDLAPEWKEYELPLPEGLVKGGEELEVGFRFAQSVRASSVPGSEDWRTLSVGFDCLEFE